MLCHLRPFEGERKGTHLNDIYLTPSLVLPPSSPCQQTLPNYALIFTLFLLATIYFSTTSIIDSSILPSCILLVHPHLCSEWPLLYNHQKSDFNSRLKQVLQCGLLKVKPKTLPRSVFHWTKKSYSVTKGDRKTSLTLVTLTQKEAKKAGTR